MNDRYNRFKKLPLESSKFIDPWSSVEPLGNDSDARNAAASDVSPFRPLVNQALGPGYTISSHISIQDAVCQSAIKLAHI